MNVKQYLIEILDFYKHKLENDACTMDEMNDAMKTIEQNMNVKGTISDFAKFYDKPEVNVRAVISRKVFAKPVRKLLYPFLAIAKSVPDKWHKEK